MSRRGRRRAVGALLTVMLVAGAVAYGVLFVGGREGRGPLADSGSPGGEQPGPAGPTPAPSPPPTVCPLSGIDPEGEVPLRPALAIKVENLPASRPQTGVSWADIVYEQPVEVNITRFIAIYQCDDASRVEPVRSARLTDPDILVQYGRPLFAFAGAVPKVLEAIRGAGLVDVNEARYPDAYDRDPEREAPHDLTTDTRTLYGLYRGDDGPPEPVFEYSTTPPRAPSATTIHVDFSSYSDVYWRWNPARQRYVRYHGDVPHTYSDGTPVTATNVIVQVVKVEMTDVRDVNGAPSPRVLSVGSGRAYLFRDGKVVAGTWGRRSVGDITVFRNARGREIRLAPGQTWIELTPTDVEFAYD